jgi:hypothetical protein
VPERNARGHRREELLRQVNDAARLVIFGSLSEIYRTCGNPGCRCHGPGPKHGPHLQVVYKGDSGKTSGYYVPKSVQPDVRQGVAAWKIAQEALRELAALNRDELLDRAKIARQERSAGRPGTRARSAGGRGEAAPSGS